MAVAACGLIAVGGLIATRFIKSPAQVAADTAPPRLAPLTAAVKNEVLHSTVVERGTITATSTHQITPLTPTQGAAAQILTGIRNAVGDAIKPGQVILEVSGRPLVALPGAVPVYRDMKPSDSGKDVTELQDALASLGKYHGGDQAGYFGAATKTAVTDFYTSIGYSTPTTAGAAVATERSDLRAAQSTVDAAQRAVDDLKLQLKAQAPNTSPEPGTESLSVQLQYLQKTLKDAQVAQADLIASTGPMAPMGEIAFLPSFPARVSRMNASVGNAVAAPLVTLTTGPLVVSAKVSQADAASLKAGMQVDVIADAIGLEASGVISAIGSLQTGGPPQANAAGPANTDAASGPTSAATGVPDAGGTAGSSGAAYIPVEVTPSTPLTNLWDGQDVRLTITSAETDGEVLVVPLAAVSIDASGQASVTKISKSGAAVPISVKAGLSANGFVAVSPTRGGLVNGDLVAIS